MKMIKKTIFLIVMTCIISLGMMAQDIGITGDSTINQCETKTYTISILNNSGNPLTNLEITGRLGNLTGFSYVSGTTTIDVNGGAICNGAGDNDEPVVSGTDLIWDIDTRCPNNSPFTLANGQTLNITFNLATDCTAVSGSLNVHFEYEISGTPMTDNTGAHSIQVLPGGVTIKKTPNVIPQYLGQDVTWTLTIENSGYGIIENVVVTDVLGAGLAYVSSTPAGVNTAQTTTWGTAEIAGFASMNPGQIITIDITATVISCQNLDNSADARWGCDLVTDCYNTALTAPPSTAEAAVERIPRSPLLEYTPPDVSFTYCSDQENVAFTITNTGDGEAHNIWLMVDFGSLTVSNLSAGAVYNAADNRFELADPIAPGGTYDLSFTLNYSTWCGVFPAGELLWQTVYLDECDQAFYPPVKLSTVNPPTGSTSLSLTKAGGGEAIQIGDQVVYNIASTYNGPLSCGSGSVGDITVVDTVPDGFTVVDAGGGTWVPGGSGTGGTITWTYTPPASLNTSITLQAPDRTQCETYCFTTFTNSAAASGIDCCGCTMNASSSQTSAIECEEFVNSNKTANPVTQERCETIEYTNTYDFSSAGIYLNTLTFTENAENQQQYVPGSLIVTYDGADITACVLVTDTTPGGNLSLDFSGCAADLLNNKNLTIVYRLRITEATVTACGGTTFYSWSGLQMGAIGSECLQDGEILETAAVTVQPPVMSVFITDFGQIIDKCQTHTITLTLTQTSSVADPNDVRLVLSGLNYYVVDPASAVCSGPVAPTSCTPVLIGDDYVWYFGDGFTGSGQSAVIRLDVRKRCTGGGDLVATAFYDDLCHDDGAYDDSCSTITTETPVVQRSGDLLIEKTPEVYYATSNTVEWKVYVINRGTGTAYFVWVDDVLGAGLDYVSAVVDDMTGVTVTADQDHNGTAINGCTIAISDMTPGERRAITLTAQLIACDNLTNDVSTSWGCAGLDCQVPVSDSAVAQIPRPLLINTNVVTTPADACTDPQGYITLRNAGQTTCYNLQITDTLPVGLTYIPGTTRWRFYHNGSWGAWNGPNAAYDPNPTVSPLVWTSTQISGLATADPGDTIEIEYDLHANCPFIGGNVTLSTQYENPCGQVFTNADSVFTVAFQAPQVTVTKTRVNEPIDCGQLIEWSITVTNTSGYTLPIIWVEDTMDAAFTYSSSVGDPTYTSDNGTVNGQVVTWEVMNLPHNGTATLTLRATTDTSPCSPNLDNTVLAWWGCGAADGSSATKPGEDPPDNTLCLSTSSVSVVRTETREPSMSFLDIALNPVSIDSCDDSTELTITIRNTGPTDASNVDLVITLPAGITYNAGTSAVTCGGVLTDPAPDPVVSGNQLIYYNVSNTANNLCNVVQASGGNDTVTLVFNVRSNCYVTANVGFRLYYYDCCGDTQYNTTTNETLTSLYPALSVTKTPQNNQVDCGANQTWTITVTNNGAGNAQVVRIEDTLGDWIDYVGSNPAATSMGGQVYGWEINNLAAGASQSFDITGQLNPDAPQNDCSALLRRNNVSAIWGCGIAGDSVDGDPTTTGYDCTYTAWANATAANLAMPDLLVTSITPTISCTSDGVLNGSISVTVRNQGDGVATGGFQVSVDDGAGWSGTVSYGGDLTAGGENTLSIDVSPDCTPCTYNFNATVDVGDTICECREDNNTFGPQAYSPDIPDLEVASDTLAIVCVVDGQYRISGTVTLRNAGCAGIMTQNIPVQFTLFSGAGCGGAQVAQWTQTFSGVSIAAGATQVFTITDYTITGNACTSATGCQFSIRTEADYNDVICECDGTDNTLCSDKTVTIPDLRVDSDTLAISCSVDGQIRIQGNLVVANDGCGGNFVTNIPIRIRVYTNNAACSGVNGVITFNQAGVNIPAGGTQTFAINRTLNRNLCTNSTGCQVALGVELDYNNTICECANANNNYCAPNKTVSIPDLQVTGDTLSVNCLQDGQVRVSGTATIANTGCNAAVAGNLPVRFTLFSNINCGGAQLAQWTETFAGANIAAGASQVFTIANLDIITNICTNSTGCQVSLRLEADPGAVICECSGGNNSRCSNKTVSVPDLRITAVTPSITCTTDGTLTGTVQVTVNNNGCGAANNLPVRLTSDCGYVFTDQTVAALAAGASTTLTYSFTPNLAACTCTFTAAADPDNVICECDGTNNSLAAAPYTSPVPDLTITDIDFSNVTCANDNISGSVTVTVNNQGCGTANNFQVSLTTDGCLSFTNQTVVTLAAGASTTLTFNISGSWADCTDGSCQFTAEVDAPGTVCEYDGTNNTRTETYNSTLPDLEVTDIDFSGITCTNDNISGSVAVTINNRGVGNAANFQVSLATDGCLSFTNQAVANLAAGAGTTLTFNVSGSWADCTDCDCVFTATVDPTNAVCECDGTNNTLAETYTFNLPDLVVDSVTPTATCVDESNFQGTVTVNVSNTGCAAVNNAVVRMTSSCGYVFADQTVNLAAGASDNLVFTYTPTCPNCTCTFTATIDPDGTVCECNGTNNTVTSAAFNLDVPDVTVEADALGVACDSDGLVTVSGTITLGNRGCGSNLTVDVPVRITLYDNTGCTGNQLDQWTETLTGVNIPAGGGTQAFTITNRTIATNLVTSSTNCRVSLRIEADYIVVDLGDAICECDGTNNDYCTADKNVDIPDLQVTGDTLNVTCAGDGQVTVSGTVTMTNSGCGSNLVTNIPVRFTLYDNTGCAGSTLSQWTETLAGVNIAAGGGTQVFTITPYNITTNMVANSTNCRVSLRVEADYTDTICESDGTDNTYCADNKDVDIPDLQVSTDTLGVTCLADGQVTVTGTVTMQNNGCGTNLAANIPVRFTLYDNTGCAGNQLSQWTETLAGVNIAAGGGTQVFTITPQNVTTNICTNSTGCQVSILIEADYTNSICESDGTDNTRCTDKPIAIPDLTVNSVTPTSSCVNDSNFQGTVTVNVANTGCTAANNAVVRLTSSCGYTFTDQTVTLAAGANANLTFTYTPTCPNCTCTFTAAIDPDDLICECDGTNNTLTSADFNLDVPDVTVEADTLGVTCAADGQVTVSGTVTLGNRGCGSNLAANVPVRFTLYDNTGCAGNQLDQWTETLSGVNIASGGGTQAFTITNRTVTTNLVTNSTSCRVSLRVEADYNDSICECDGTNNTYCADNKAVDIPDLQVTGDTLGVTCLSDGQVTVSGTVTMTNSGCGSNLVTNIPVRFTLYDNTGCGGNQLSQWTETLAGVNIAAGGGTQVFTITNHNVTTNLVANSTGCQVSIRVEADYSNTICESDGTNNTRCADNKAVDIPDLQVSTDTLGVTCLADGQVTVTGTVTMQNNGCGTNLAANIPVRFTLYDNTGCAGNQLSQWTETLAGVNIAAGGGTQVFTITPQNVTTNICTNSTGCQVSILIEADYTNSICESDGTDNTRCTDKTIAVPDITVNSVTPTSSCVNDSNFQGTVTVNVANTGCTAANNAVVRLTSSCGYTFTDQTVTLAAGANANLTFTYTPTCPNCTCTFTAAIDPDDLICECDGTNNTLTSADFNLDVPDVTVEADTLGVTCAADGQVTISGTVTLGNRGCGSNLAANVPVRFTLYDNTGCAGNQLDQWTETLSGVNIAAGGGTQAITITNRTVTTNLVTNSTGCRVSLFVEADYNDTICECDGTNNTYCADNKAVDIPDLQVTGDTLGITCLTDGQVTVSGTVTMTNSGCGSNLIANIPVRFTLYNNTGCGGSTLSQWTETLAGVNIAAGGGTQVFTITNHNVTTNLVTNSTNCRVSLRVEADYSNTICESDGTNNIRCADNKAVDIPDLQVSNDTLGVTCLADGQVRVSGTVTMINNGCGSNLAANIPVRFTLYDNTGCAGNQLSQWTETLAGVNIAAGGGTQVFTITNHDVTANICTNSTGCQVSILIEADYTNSICESDGTDNTRCTDKTVAVPDITVNSVTPSITCVSDGNLQGTVVVNVSNTGCGTASNAVVRLTSDCGITFTDQTVTLAAGASTDVTFTYTPVCTACTCTFTATLDPLAALCECDGTNNTLASAPFTMTVPDIEVQADALAVTCAGDNQVTVTGTVTLLNNGCGANLTADIPVRFTLLDNTGCTGNQLSQWTQTFTAVSIASGGGTQTFTITPQTVNTNLCTNSTGCQVSIRVEADYNNTVCECDGTDNTYCADNKAVDIPDLEVQTDTLGVTCAADGQVTVSGTVTMANTGCGANLVTDIPVRFTLYDNTGCSGNQLLQWTQVLTGVNIASSGGTQAFTITPQTLTANLVNNSTNCRVSIRVEPDYTDVICECNSNNTYCADNKAVDIPDLEIQGDTLGFTCIDDGQYRISGTVTLRNNGCGSNLTDNVAVRFTLNDGTGDGCSGTTLLQWTETFAGVNIPAGGTQTFTITARDASASLCSSAINNRLYIYMEADYTNAICESDGTDNTLCSEKTVSIPELVVNTVANTVVCNNDGSLDGTTVNVSNIGNAAATGVVVRLTSDCGLTFADETVNLAAGETREVFFPFTAGIVTCVCNFTAVIDPDNTVCECSGINNTRTSTADMLIPDLEVQSEALTIDCQEDGVVRVSGTVTLVNNGCGPAFTGNIPMRFSLYNRPGCGGSLVNQWTQTLTGVNLAPAGGTQTFRIQNHDITTNFYANSTNCQVSLRIEADYNGSICEWDGTDNTYCTNKTSDCLDLEAASVTPNISVTPGATCDENVVLSGTIAVTVRNSGGNPITRDFSIRVEDGQGWSSELRYHADLGGTLPLPAGASSTVTFNWNRVFDTATCQYPNITAVVDSQNEICQCTIENDTAAASYQMTLPNLRPTAVTPDCSADGQYLVRVTVENNGCGNAGSFIVHLADNLGHTMDVTVGSLAQGSTATVEFPGWPAACEPKTVIFTATVDFKNTVCEITGTDNIMETTYTNTSPDLVITDVKPSAGCNAPGNVTGSFTLTLENKGNGPVTQDFKVIVNDGEGWSSEKFYQADLNGVLPIAVGGTVTVDIPWDRNFTSEPFKCDFNNITVGLDLQTSVCECGTANNDTVATYRLPYPDIVLQTLQPMCKEDGKRQIQLTIGNKGCADQGDDFNITFTDSLGGNRTVSFTAMGGRLPLRTGTTQTLNLADWEFNCTGGTTVYTATIGVGAGFCDLKSDNNTMTVTQVQEEPDLLFGDITSTCNGDGSITFTVTVLNQGKGAANNVPVRIYDGNGNLVHSRTVNLPAGGQAQFSYTTGSYPTGQMLTFRFVVDEDKQYCECDGSNNEKSTNIRCEGGGEGEPQLKLAKYCPPGQGPGGLFRFELQISNTGTTDLENVKIIDFLPGGFQYVKGSSALNGRSIPDPEIASQLTWTIATLPKGAIRTLVFTAVADADIDPGRYCNEALAEASLSGSALTIKSDQVQCCTVVPRQAGAGCCLKVEEWGLSPWRLPEGPLSFIEPYFRTEYAMYTVYAIFNLWQDVQLEKGTMPLFMKERLQNYARSTIEEFYLNSKLGLTQPDNTLWLSYAGAYPERGHSWVRKQVDQTMTASQLGFELLALNEAVKIEERENLKQKLQDIIQKKLTFLGYFLDELPHAWEITKDEVKVEVKVEEAIKKYVKKQDEKATLYDKTALYLAMVELETAGTANADAKIYAKKLREMLKSIDGQEFDRDKLREEFLFTLALLETGQTEQAKAKIREFEKILTTEDTEGTEGESAAKTREETRRGVLDNLHDYALAAAVDYKAGGTLYKEIKKEMQDKYYLQDVGIFAEKQPDFTFKLKLHSLAPLIFSFDNQEPGEHAHNATVLYRTFDEVGLFLKKRNLSMGKPLYSLLKNYPFTEPLLPVLSFTRANGDIAPVFSRDAVVHSTQLKPIGEILIPGNFSKIFSPSYETGTSRVAAASFGLQYLGRLLKEKEERVIKEEGRSLDETGKAYIDSLLKSGAGIQYKGKTLLPYDHLAVKGPKKDEHNLEALDAGTGAQISTEALANYLLAEKLYIEGKGKYAEAVQEIMVEQDRVVQRLRETGAIPEKFGIFMEEETGQITILPSPERAGRLTVAKLEQVYPRDRDRENLAAELKALDGKLEAEDLIYIAAMPELEPYFKEEIKLLVDYKDSQVAYNAADVVGRRLLGDDKDKIAKSLENLQKHWDKEVLLPTSDRIEDIEKGLIYHHEPQQFMLYLLAAQEGMDFRFERTLNFFTYLLENEWGVEWESYITLPSLDYEVFKEEPKENAEPGDLLTFRVRVDNTCPEGYGSAHDLPSLYLKAAFRPSLIYAGTQRVEGLDVLGEFQWSYQGMTQGSVLEYLYQAIVPAEISFSFIDGWIYAGGRQGYEEFGPDSSVGDDCEDIHNLRRLNIIPFEVIKGLVYEDRNLNGIKDVGERGIANILIKDTRGRLIRSDAEGRFTVLAGDEHEGLQVELKSVPYNYLMIENPTKLVNRRYTGEIYFGLIPCTTVTGFVYLDENRNGVYDDGESRPEGVMLKAKDKEVLTGKNGQFIFRNLPELWKEWIEVKKEQWYYKGSIENLKFKIEEK